MSPSDVGHVLQCRIHGFFLVRNRIAVAGAIRMRTID